MLEKHTHRLEAAPLLHSSTLQIRSLPIRSGLLVCYVGFIAVSTNIALRIQIEHARRIGAIPMLR